MWKQVGLALLLALITNASEAQSAQAEIDAELEARANSSLRAPATTFGVSTGLSVGLGITTAILAVMHCEGSCDGLYRGTLVAFAGTMAAATLALGSLIWWITKGGQRSRARARLGRVSLLGTGLRF